MKLNVLAPTIFLALAIPVVSPAAPCDDLKVVIDTTYGFKPSKLTAQQIDSKSGQLDVVWNKVKGNPSPLLPCLRSEIEQRKPDAYFRFDASNLLYSLDKSLETKKLMVETYAQVDLADINLRYWLPNMAQFGREGLDVSKAGETWLRFPKPVYYLPEHGALPVDKGIGALAIFGSMDESMATPHLARLAAEVDTDFRGIVIWLLVNQATRESQDQLIKLKGSLPPQIADAVVKEAANPKLVEARVGAPKTTRITFIKAMTELLEDKPDAWISTTSEVADGERDMVVVLTEADLPLIRKVRRAFAANATPHSPDWYSSFTQIINTIQAMAKNKKASN